MKGSCLIGNVGFLPAATFYVQLYYSTDNILDGGDIPLLKKPKRIPKLMSGKPKAVKFNYKTYQNPSGYFIISVDMWNDIMETSEGNNAGGAWVP